MIELNNIIKKLIEIILSYKKPEKIILFGSQANGDFQERSDIDIAIYAKEWDAKDFNILKDKIEEDVKTPLKFDIVDYYRVTKESLKTNIDKGVILYDTRKN